MCLHKEKERDELDYDSDDKRDEEDKSFLPNFSKEIDTESNKHKQYCRVKKKRKCPTDLFCTILFGIFLVGMVAVGVIAFVFGDPRLIVKPTDYLGRVCGTDMTNAAAGVIKIPGDIDCKNSESKNQTAIDLCEQKVQKYKINLKNRKYLWYMELREPLAYGGVCVSFCPGAQSEEVVVGNGTYCPPELTKDEVEPFSSALDILSLEYCAYNRDDLNASFPLTTTVSAISSQFVYFDVLNRCVPTFKFLNSTNNAISDAVNSAFNEASEGLSRLWSDVYKSWKVVVCAAILAFFLSFIFLIVIRLITGIVVWVCVGFCFVALCGVSAFLLWQGYTDWQNMKSRGLSTTYGKVVFGFGCGTGLVATIYGIVVAFLFLRIRRAIGVIEESTKALQAMPQILILPVALAAFLILFGAYWVVVALYLFSYGQPEIDDFAVVYNMSKWTRGIFAYHIFGGLWVSQFLISMEYLMVAGAVASWYWRPPKKKRFVVGLPVSQAILRTIVFHTGTAAFGSLIVATIEFIRIMFERGVRELKFAVMNNRIAKAIVWFVRIILWVFEKMVKYINKHSYIQTAIYGTSFITSSMQAFELITKNAVQLGVLDTLSTIIFIIAKFSVAIITAGGAYAIAAKTTFLNVGEEVIYSPLFVAFISFIIAYFIASVFVTILEVAVDTVLQCYLIDNQVCTSDKSGNTKPHCTGTLARIIKEEQKFKAVCHICSCLTCDCCSGGGAGDVTPDLATNVEMHSS